MNSKGMDISGILRGKLAILDEIIDAKNIFTHVEDLEKTIEDEKKKGANK